MNWYRIRISLFLAALSLAASVGFAETFEGQLQLSFSTPTLKNEATGYMKGLSFKILPKATAKMEGVEGYPVIDFASGKFMLISPKDRYYLTLPLAQLQGPIDKVSIKMRKSGRTDTILGHAAEEFVVDDPVKKLSIAVWATKDLQTGINFFLSLQKIAPNEGVILGRMAKELIAQGYFPLGATAKDAKGLVTLQMAVVGISPGRVDDREFAIPEGYGKMSDVLKKKK